MEIEEFTVRVPDGAVDEMRSRVRQTRWPAAQGVPGWNQGTDLTAMRDLAAHWGDGFDWRAQEAVMNRVPQYLLRGAEVPIHAIHVRGVGPDPIPLVLTHGWPSTFHEFHKVIGPLTNPAAHGGDERDAFHVVVPSLPGYGFSGIPTNPGLDPDGIADVWVQVMAAFGYDRFASHGGDWGAAVTGALAHRHPDRLIGIHLTMLSPPIDVERLTPAQQRWWDDLQRYRDEEWGYVHLQRTKPQTPAFALSDSPVGTAAWILEKWWRWSDIAGPDGERDLLRVYTADELLTVASIYWLTETIGPSLRLYHEAFGTGSVYRFPGRLEVPTGISAFRDPNAPPRELLEPWCDLRYYAEAGPGGHFPAMENPAGLVEELRTYFRQLR